MNSSGESAAREQSAEALAKMFHEAYERLASQFGYSTRPASAVPWEQVPDNNKRLMIAVCGEIARHYAAREREEWIPVSERLPEPCEIVTMWNGQQRHQGFRSATDGDFHYCITGNVAERVTHWCRIPAAPFAAKGETE